MNIMDNIRGHLTTINSHKAEVMRMCFKLGLYKQGLMHDLSKYSPKEFIPGVIFYCGYRSPNNAERDFTGKSEAWLHHKGRNRHHFEYWLDYGVNGNCNMQGIEMPVRYVAEMFCDRVAASKTYLKEEYNESKPFEYFIRNHHHYMMHPKTKQLLGKLLLMLKKYGEEETLRFIRIKLLNRPFV